MSGKKKKEKDTGAVNLKDIPLELRHSFHLTCLQNRVSMRNAFLAFMRRVITDPEELRALILEDARLAILAAREQKAAAPGQ